MNRAALKQARAALKAFAEGGPADDLDSLRWHVAELLRHEARRDACIAEIEEIIADRDALAATVRLHCSGDQLDMFAGGDA